MREGDESVKSHVKGVWSSGMILASGARGREFDSRNAPNRRSATGGVFSFPFGPCNFTSATAVVRP
ncbi:hypothetical protein Csa_021291 [Cucumis sativus]|uniref:Uncharacterized protein n=1 Tax=Cucumis sativus TaxID=3659 RepID=A0A0A0LFZ3_CUCSA|nr:hypothetical protein Csa_021291 [Cucumis sativus]